MSPRILFVDHAAVLGGAELSLLDIARHFRARSEVVLFADGPFRERLEAADVAVEVLSAGSAVGGVTREGGLLQDLLALPGVVGLALELARRATRFDLIYANSQKSMIIGALAGLVARKPVVWHLRDIMSAEHFSPLHRWVAAAVSNLLVTRVLANSEASRRALVAAGGRASKIFTVHNAIDPAPFEAVDPQAAARLRAELGLNGGPVFGVFSRLSHWKGQHVLLEALRDVPDAHALLVGDVLFDVDRPYAHELRARAARYGLTDRVHFLGFRDDVPALLHMVDGVLHTSTAPEPFGRVIVEGMLAGRPVVATRAGGAVEIIDPDRTGLLVPPGDASALADALRRLLADPGTAQEIAEAGREAAYRRFTLSSLMQSIEAHLTAVLNRTS